MSIGTHWISGGINLLQLIQVFHSKGFALGLQFNPKSPLNNEITGEDMTYFQKFHQLIGAAPALPGSPDVAGYQSKLRQARSLLAERYGFAAANLGDDDGEDGW